MLVKRIETLCTEDISVNDVKNLCASLKIIREISSDELELREQLARIKAMEKSSDPDTAAPRRMEVVFAPEVEECSV